MTFSIARQGTKNISGSIPHYVTNKNGDCVGWIDEIFNDVFYVKPSGRLYADNQRYRSIEKALQSPEWENATVMISSDSFQP